MENNDGGNAFPTTEEKSDHGINYLEYSDGMTLRDYFAGQAISVLANDYQLRIDVLVHRAYEIADAMITEREL